MRTLYHSVRLKGRQSAVKSRSSTISRLKQFVLDQLFTATMSGLLNQTSVLSLTTLSCWYLCDQSRISGDKGECGWVSVISVFEQTTSQRASQNKLSSRTKVLLYF